MKSEPKTLEELLSRDVQRGPYAQREYVAELVRRLRKVAELHADRMSQEACCGDNDDLPCPTKRALDGEEA